MTTPPHPPPDRTGQGAGVERVPHAQTQPVEQPRERARAGVESFLALLASQPAFAQALQVEVLTAGPAALDRRAGMLVMFGGIWRNVHERARSEEPDLPALPDEVFTILSAGLEELVRDCIRTRGPAALPELAGPILRTVVAIFGAGSH